MAEIVWLPPIGTSNSTSVSLMDAMETLVLWNRVEMPLRHRIKRKRKISYAWFADLLAHYHFTDAFPHKNRSSAAKKKTLADILSSFRGKREGLDYVTVLAHELEPFTASGKDASTHSPLGAASRVMWYYNPDDIVLYSDAAARGLEYLLEQSHVHGDSTIEMQSDMECETELEMELADEDDIEFELEIPLDLNSYFDFHQCWFDMYLEHAAEIKMVCDNLFQLCDFEYLPEGTDYFCLNQEWFHRKVFSVWLERLG